MFNSIGTFGSYFTTSSDIPVTLSMLETLKQPLLDSLLFSFARSGERVGAYFRTLLHRSATGLSPSIAVSLNRNKNDVSYTSLPIPGCTTKNSGPRPGMRCRDALLFRQYGDNEQTALCDSGWLQHSMTESSANSPSGRGYLSPPLSPLGHWFWKDDLVQFLNIIYIFILISINEPAIDWGGRNDFTIH